MKVRFTRHAKEKFHLMRMAEFKLSEKEIISIINKPLKSEAKSDGTIIATQIFDKKHVIRVVYKVEDDILLSILEGEKHMKYKYDPESHVLSITLKKKPFQYAREAGDFIVHYDTNDIPVYVEILNAHDFVTHAMKSLPEKMASQTLFS